MTSGSGGPLVLDVAYDRLQTAHGSWDVGALVAGVDATSVRIGEQRRHPREAWAAVLDTALADAGETRPDVAVLAHPTTWGPVRLAVLVGAATDAVEHLQTVARAALVAETHLEVAARMCLVLEVHSGRVDVHTVRQGLRGWQVVATDVRPDELSSDALGPPGETVEAIVVDGPDPARVARVVAEVERTTPVGRVLAADRDLMHRYAGVRNPRGARSATGRHAGTNADAEPTSSPRRSAVVLWIAAAVAIVLGIAAIWVAIAQSRTSEPAAGQAFSSVTAGDVTLQVPSAWTRSETAGAARTVFADPRLGGRIVVVQNRVPATATLASVATSLRNRIDQTGGATVTEFSAATHYADRVVISYRELAGSGGTVRWYVGVDDAVQVSIGCQDGPGSPEVEAACVRAVGTAAVARS